MPAPRDARLTGIVLVFAATVLWSTAGLFVRALDLDVWTIACWRSLFAGCSLLLIALVRGGRRLPDDLVRFGRPGWLAVLISGLSMFCYVAALKLTTVANVMVVYATVPFVAAGIAYVMVGERIGRRAAIASAAALVGVLVTALGAGLGRDLTGDALALGMTTTFALVLVMMRRFPTINVALVNALAAFGSGLACAALGATVPGPSALAILCLFGFVTTALAYLMFLTGGRYIPSGEAGLIALLDVVLGPLWVWLAFAERPGGAALVGGTLVLAAVTFHLVGEIGRARPAPIAAN